MKIPVSVVDAFADKPFEGNPAAVCLTESPLDPALMQRIAAEMNLSETSFLVPTGESYSLRWFTPVTEVDLCGHATLASAHALWESGALGLDRSALFDTRSGRLTCRRDGGLIAMDFPADPFRATDLGPSAAAALRATPTEVVRGRFDLLARFEKEEEILAIAPDFGVMKEIPVRGIIVTAPAQRPGFDFVSRFFAPALGVPEDPVCGSAHCTLGGYWRLRLGKDNLVGRQVSARGGTVSVRANQERVVLAGKAVTVIKGQIESA